MPRRTITEMPDEKLVRLRSDVCQVLGGSRRVRRDANVVFEATHQKTVTDYTSRKVKTKCMPRDCFSTNSERNRSTACSVKRIESMPNKTKAFNSCKDLNSTNISSSTAFGIPRTSNSSKHLFAVIIPRSPARLMREQPPKSSRLKGSKCLFDLRFPSRFKCFAVSSVSRQQARKNRFSNCTHCLQMSSTSKSISEAPRKAERQCVSSGQQK